MPIPWDESAPPDSDAYSQTANVFRSLKTAIATGISQFAEWPGSGGGSAESAGQMKLGTFRAFYALQSRLSNPSVGTSGRLFIASDSSRLFGFVAPSSSSTFMLGSARAIEGLTFPGQAARWVVSSGTTTGNIGSCSLGTTYSVSPTVLLSIYSSSQDTALSIQMGAVPTTSGFSFVIRNLASQVGPAETIVQWASIGTVPFP